VGLVDADASAPPQRASASRGWVYAVFSLASAVLAGGLVFGLTARGPSDSVATPTPPIPPPLASPFAAGQTWSGTYICAQGSTSLVLHIVAAARGRVDAIFELDYQPKHVHGSFKTTGTYDPSTRELDLLPGVWITQPVNYVTVTMSGRVSDDGRTYSGSIGGPSCTTFSIHRDDAAP
jgi:hypothetical protein